MTSATQSSALSNTRMTGALTSPPACLASFASAMWLGLPSAVDSATVTPFASCAKRASRSPPAFKAESARTAKAMYSVTSVAMGVYLLCSKLATPTR